MWWWWKLSKEKEIAALKKCENECFKIFNPKCEIDHKHGHDSFLIKSKAFLRSVRVFLKGIDQEEKEEIMNELIDKIKFQMPGDELQVPSEDRISKRKSKRLSKHSFSNASKAVETIPSELPNQEQQEVLMLSEESDQEDKEISKNKERSELMLKSSMPVSNEPKSPVILLEEVDHSSEEKSKKLNTNLSTEMVGEGYVSPISSRYRPESKFKKLST